MATSRRAFLQTAASTGAVLGFGQFASRSAGAAPRPQDDPTSEKLDLLILGGTGFLGPHIVNAALEGGHSMTLFNRGKTNPHLFPDLEKLEGDRNTGDIDALKGRSWDAVIDTSGYVPAHVDATASLLADRIRQYIFISSISVYADHREPVDESSKVIELDQRTLDSVQTIRESMAHYGGMKAHCEVAAEAAMSGRVANIRPGLIVGPRDTSDRFTYWPVRIAAGGQVLAPGGGDDPVQWIDARDLAQWIVHCIEQNVTGVYNAVLPGGRYTMAEMLHGCKAITSAPIHFFWADSDFLERHEVSPWMNMPCWVPPVDQYAGFSLSRADRAVEAGLTFRPLAETALDTLQWHRAERPVNYQFGQRAGLSRAREAELLELLQGNGVAPS